jgi:predicted transcriptional regulator of viral defense system/very-short-patch-repair endonuclease
MRTKSRTVEEKMARIAERQHGVVTRAQLLDAGISPSSIKRRARKGELLPVHRGVYRVGHRAPSLLAQYMAAVLACGPGSVLAGRAAGYLLGLIGGDPPLPSVINPSERQVPGIRTRRSERGPTTEATTFRGIPVTTVARTLVDLAAELPPDGLARAVHQAAVRYRATPREVEAALSRRPRTKGAGELRAVLRGDIHVTLSELEDRFLELLRQADLPLPETNRPSNGYRVDCRWADHCLTVELDSYRYHHTRHAWETDRRRERVARARGDEFRRYSWGDVFEQPQPMMREITELLPAHPAG